MNCPFCQHANAATSRACRVCGAPLGAVTPKIAAVAVNVSVPTPVEIARQTFDESAGELVAARFLAGENPRICLVRENGGVQLWNVETNEVSSFSIGRRFRKFVPLNHALGTENFVLTGHENGEVRWHNWNGHERRRLDSHVGRVLALASSATQFYSGGSDGVIWATELESKAKSRALIEGLGAMTTFAAAPDARLIAVGCDDGAVALWRFDAEEAAFKLDWTRNVHNAPISSLSFSSNGQMIVSRDRSGALNLWAAQSSYQLPLPSGAEGSHAAPAFSSDNRLLAVANPATGVAIFDVALGILLHQLPPSNEEIAHLSFATEATWLLVAGARQVAVWNVL